MNGGYTTLTLKKFVSTPLIPHMNYNIQNNGAPFTFIYYYMVLMYGYAKLVNFAFLKQDNFIFAIIPKYYLKIY